MLKVTLSCLHQLDYSVPVSDCLVKESYKDTCLAPKLCLEVLILIPLIQPLLLSAYLFCTISCTRCWVDMTGGGVLFVGANFGICLFGTTEWLP